MKNIFFDLGHQFAYCSFDEKKLQTLETKKLNLESKKSLLNKIYEFNKFLNQKFPKNKNIDKIGCFFPYGINRQTIIHLAMMSAVLLLHFEKNNFYFLNEWQVWKKITENNKIPRQKIKKIITIERTQEKFNLKKINNDEADAILGCYYLTFFC